MDYEVSFQKVNHLYKDGIDNEFYGLKNINLNIKSGSFNAIIGKTGSGKTTLIKHINGLLKPSSGYVNINGCHITSNTKEKELYPIRKQIGIVFQFPEKQLFGETVLKDIEFGPSNYFDDKEKIKSLSLDAVKSVGLPIDILNKSPFDLSGGQQRKVAIAGVLACKPRILILDEPTVGLDDQSKKKFLDLIQKLHQVKRLTIILITHQMDIVSEYADNVIVMKNGEINSLCTPREFFLNSNLVESSGVDLPEVVKFAKELESHGFEFEKIPIKKSELIKILKQRMED